MSDDTVNIEVDGRTLEARKGQMVMEVTDEAGIYIPRFCYHKKLSVAANCRMCLVEVEKAPKPMPACALPVAEGMKVSTRSEYAIAAQKATMEFLLINHPLDCPICDQGGECELQDLAMGYGRGVSRYHDQKRVVKDKNLGPLISTDMTRCIHCTRCVRFGEEIQGVQELGTMGRGEWMRIDTFVEQNVDHELSGNIIDLCPVGALNNKPYRYSARAWEMVQRPLVSPHDCVGSNFYAHALRGTVKRVVPRENEAINETWISDRDRFSYEGIYSDRRLKTPKIKQAGEWRDASWEEALEFAGAALMETARGAGPEAIGMLASPSATLEEHYLLAQLAAHLGTANIDHRLRQRDFSADDADPVYPWLGLPIAKLENRSDVLIVGSNLRREAPMLAHRVRKAALAGGRVSFVNPAEQEYLFDLHEYRAGSMLAELAGVAAALAADGVELPGNISDAAADADVDDAHRRIAEGLRGERALVLLGHIASRHPAWARLRLLAAALAEASGATLGYVSEGANSAGACLAGVLPHRGLGGVEREHPGLAAGPMLAEPRETYLLLNLDPVRDLADAKTALAALGAARANLALTSYESEALDQVADVMLPIGSFAETAGTYINVEGRRQSFAGAASPVGESRPAWKVLRVLGNLLEAPGFGYESAEEVRGAFAAALAEEVGGVEADNRYRGEFALDGIDGGDDPGAPIDLPMYQIDPLVRHARALQRTVEGRLGRELMERLR